MRRRYGFALMAALLIGGLASAAIPSSVQGAASGSEFQRAVVVDAALRTDHELRRPILDPYDGQSNVELETIRNSAPEAEYYVYRTGYRILFQPDEQRGDTLIEEFHATITDSKGHKLVYVYEIDLANRRYTLFPLEVLNYGETYTVSVDYNGSNTTWSFTTMDEPEQFEYPVSQPEESSALYNYVRENIRYTGFAFQQAELYAYVFSEGLALSVKHHKFGYIDAEGREAIPHMYGMGRNFSEGLAAVYDSEIRKWGYIDKEGQTVIPFIYAAAEPFAEGLGAVKDDNGRWGFISKAGDTLIPHLYDNVELFSYGTALAVQHGKEGIIDTSGAIVVPFEYMARPDAGYKTPSDSWYAGLLVDRDGPVKYFSKVDKKLLEFPGIDDVVPMGDRDPLLLAYRHGMNESVGLQGVIDSKGNVIVPFEYNLISSFSEGLASAGKYDSTGGWKFGYIDRSGHVVVPLLYETAQPFSEGVAVVGTAHSFNVWNYALIDQKGRVIQDNLIYTDISPMSNGQTLVSKWIYDHNGNLKDRLYGLMDHNGHVIVPVEYADYEIYYARNGKPIWQLIGAPEPVEPQRPEDTFDSSLGEPYADFQSDQYWSPNMLWAIQNGYISGFEENNPVTGKTEKLLKPGDPLSEAQFLTILFRHSEPSLLMGMMTNLRPKDTNWWASYPYVIAEYLKLPTKGSHANRQAAEASMTRGEMAVILASYYEMKYRGGTAVDEREAVRMMYEMGLSNGYPDEHGNTPRTYESYGADRILLREHIVTFMRNFDHFLIIESTRW